jgi:hypothetical protein
MKVRIKGNSVRLRLLQSEVNRIAEGKKVEESTHFNFKQTLTYTLTVSHNINEPKAEFKNGRLRIWLPIEMAKNWAISNEVGIESFQEVGNGDKLHILIEKDFKCLSSDIVEDQSDNFPHPQEDNLIC